jgi:hypothetical protein
MPIFATSIDVVLPARRGKCATHWAAVTGESLIAIVTPYRPVTMHDVKLTSLRRQHRGISCCAPQPVRRLILSELHSEFHDENSLRHGIFQT